MVFLEESFRELKADLTDSQGSTRADHTRNEDVTKVLKVFSVNQKTTSYLMKIYIGRMVPAIHG